MRRCAGCEFLDPGVIERVLHNDSAVCATGNKAAFDKLRGMLMMHYHVREKAVDAVGGREITQQAIAAIVENLRRRLPGKLGGDPRG